MFQKGHLFLELLVLINETIKNKFSQVKKEIIIPIIGIFFWIIYLVSAIGFDSLWGINFVRFLPLSSQFVLFSLSLGCILFLPNLIDKIKNAKSTPIEFKKAKPFILLIALVLIYELTIYKNVYGDATQFITRLGESTDSLSSKYFINLFSIEIGNPKLGNLTVLSFIRLLSYVFKISHALAFKLVGVASGLLFINLCFNYINKHIKTKSFQWILLLFVLLAPFNQLFLGHFEIYAPLIPAITWYLIQLKSLVNNPRKKGLFLFTFSLLLCIKLHFTSILLLPSFLFIIALIYKKKKTQPLIKWEFTLKWVLSPFIILGLIAYFFIFKDYNDERFLSTSVDLYDRLFLPILSPEAPLDRYTIFNFNHLFDFLNMTFLWSSAGTLLLIVLFLFYRKTISLNRPELVLTGFTLLFYIFVFFAFNPLLSMPIDFDLFSITAPLYFFFILLLLEQVESIEFVKLVGGSVIGISLFSIAIFQSNHNPEALSSRMESLGKHIFKTYWIRSAGDIQSGISLVKHNPDEYISRYLKVAADLKPYAIIGKDSEYAHILWSIGKYYRSNKMDYQEALKFHLQSEIYSTNLPANYIGLMETNYLLEQYDIAYRYSLNLMQFNYPNEKKANEIAIDCALMAGFNVEALKHIENYLIKWDNSNYRIIAENLAKSN